jgi:hypothetical protein
MSLLVSSATQVSVASVNFELSTIKSKFTDATEIGVAEDSRRLFKLW